MPWDICNDIDITDLINKSTLYINDHKHFYYVVDIVRLFGDKSEAVMTGEKRHKFEANTDIWWPQLYKNIQGWENELSS